MLKRLIIVSIRMALVTLVLTGVAYPLVVTGIASVAFPSQAAGSLVSLEGRTVGSSLIGQAFESPAYFHGRPSAAGDGYDAMASGASNLGPTSRVLSDQVRRRARAAAVAEGIASIPVDLLTASGSGLDPHISPDAALVQVARVARERGLEASAVRALVERRIERRDFGLLGEPRVNVLLLNIDLDALSSD